jgi:hypothetical protein
VPDVRRVSKSAQRLEDVTDYAVGGGNVDLPQ